MGNPGARNKVTSFFKKSEIMDVRQLFAAYRLRKRKISETEEIKDEMPLHVSHEMMIRPVKEMTETLEEKTTDINTEDLFEKEEIIRIKVQYHVKRLRMSTRKILKNTVPEKHTSKALKE